ncbi:hypothetical protein K438DRAFT_1786696 [Mycena galopus ATCC 62051]|nr:hypothetical protein K438DRAFT_1786696 [Mycena galopus ATCC 62051]
MHKTGTCSTDGVKRKGKRSANSFVAVPWAARTAAYLPAIRKLSDKKWAQIIALSAPFIDGAAEVAADETDGDESGDSRGLIQISDDEDDVGLFLQFCYILTKCNVGLNPAIEFSLGLSGPQPNVILCPHRISLTYAVLYLNPNDLLLNYRFIWCDLSILIQF